MTNKISKIIEHWSWSDAVDWVADTATNVYDASKDFAVGALGWFNNLINDIVGKLGDLSSKFRKYFDVTDFIGDAVKGLINDIKKLINKILDNLKNNLDVIINDIKDGINSAINALKSIIDTLNNAITSIYVTFINAFKTFGNIISSFMSDLTNSINEIFNKIVSKMNDILKEISYTFVKVSYAFNDLGDLLKKGGSGFINFAKDLIDTYLMSFLNFVGGIGKSLLATSDQNDKSFLNCLPIYIYDANNNFRNTFMIGFLPILMELYLKKMHVQKKPQCNISKLNDTSFLNCYSVYTNTLNDKYNFISDGELRGNLLNDIQKKPQCSETTINFILGNLEISALTTLVLYFFLLLTVKSLLSMSPLVKPSPMFEPVIPPKIIALISIALYIIHVSTKENRKSIKYINDKTLGFIAKKILPIIQSITPNNMIAIIVTCFVLLFVFRKTFNNFFPE